MTTQSFNARRRRRGKGARAGVSMGAAALSTLVLFGAPPAWANPDGGVVVRGEAAITHAPGEVVVHQRSGKTVVNWNGFSVEDGEVTRFKQPGKDSIALNRVVGKNASRIDGKLQADGHVWVVNRNGVTVGPKGRVDATGFLATTADIDDDDFMAGNHRFAKPSPNPNAKVINQGTISLGEQGFGALVAPHARNDGVIEGRLAKVVIGGAETFTLDLYGDGLIQFDATSKVKQRPEGVSALAVNTGTITADGGTVLITATAAAGVVEDVINLGGKVQAKSFAASPGRIILRGGDEGVVRVTGTLDVAGAEPAAKGGRVDVRGKRVLLTETARVKASGPAGGGEVLIGGDQSGQGPGPNAEDTVVLAGAQVSADAEVAGDGGKVIVYADKVAKVHGSLSARGGPQSGAGGFVETSGKGWLDVQVTPDVVAPNGAGGTWLIDPADLTVGFTSNQNVGGSGSDTNPFQPTADDAVLGNTVLNTALSQGTNVLLTTIGSQGTQPGNITFAVPVTGTGLGSLSVSAQGGVYFNSILNLAGNLDVSSINGPIQEGFSGSLIVAGTSSFNAGANAIILYPLTTTDNRFTGPVSLQSSAAGTVFLRNLTDLQLGPSTLAGGLYASVVGAITDSGTLSVAGRAEFEATSDVGPPITLDEPASRFGRLWAVSWYLDGSTYVAGQGAISIVQSGPMNIDRVETAGKATLAAERFSGLGAILGVTSLDLSATGAGVPLPGYTLSGTLEVSAQGAITQTGALSVGGPARFNANANAITLNDPGNRFAARVSLSNSADAPVTLVNSTSLTLADVQVSGDLVVRAASGSIDQLSGSAIGVTGASSFQADAGDLGLYNSGNDFSGPVTLSAYSGAVIVDQNDLQLSATVAAGSLIGTAGGALDLGASQVASAISVRAVGSITDSGPLSVDGNALFTVRGNSIPTIMLDEETSHFGHVGAYTRDTQGNTGLGTISIRQAGAMDIIEFQTAGTASFEADSFLGLGDFHVPFEGVPAQATNLYLRANQAGIDLPYIYVPGILGVQAQGAITQTAVTGDGLEVGGTSSFAAAANPITLDNASNALTGAVALSNSGTNDVTLVSGSWITLDTVAVGGDLRVQSLDGDISQYVDSNDPLLNGRVVVAGNSEFLADTGYIGLYNDSNHFQGSVSLTAALGADIRDTDGLDLSADVGGGSLYVRAGGDITDAGPLVVGDLSDFVTSSDAGAAITLDNPNSQLGSLSVGTYDATTGALNAGAITIELSGDLLIYDMQTAGSASFTAARFLQIGDFAPDPQAERPTSSTHDLYLVATAAGIDLPFITLPGLLDVQAQGAITQSGALLVGGTSSFDAAANPITLLNAGNAFSGAVSLTNSGPNAAQLFNSGALHLVASDVGGDLRVTALGAISGGGLSVGGAASFSTLNNAGAAITLNAGPSQFGTLSARSLDAQGSATRGGDITIVQSGAMTIAGVETTGTATLEGSTIGGLGLISSVTNLSLTATAGEIALPGFTLTGYLTAVAAGPITQGGVLRVGGTSRFEAAANAITLNDPGNAFTGAVSLNNSGNNPVDLVNDQALIVGASTLGSGALSLTAVGITQVGPLVQEANAGAVTLTGGIGAITLGNVGNDFTGPVALTSGGSGSLVDGNALTLGASLLGGGLSATTLAETLTVAGSLGVTGTLHLQAAGLLSLNAAVAGGPVDLSGGTGITLTDAGSLNSAAGLTAVATAGDLDMGEGSTATAAGSIALRAGGNVRLGRVSAGSNPITVTADGGAIVDNTLGDGSGNENLTGGVLSLTAATGIGSAVNPLDIAAATLDAVTTGPGGIYLAAVGGLQLGNTAAIATGAANQSIAVTAAGALTLAQPLRTTGTGTIDLTATGGALSLSAAVSGGSGAVTFTGTPILLGAAVTTAGGAIGFQAPVILTADAALDTTNGGAAPNGAAVDLVSMDADGVSVIPARTLTLDAGADGTINVAGAIGATAPLAGLTIANSGGATFTGAVSVTTDAGLVALTDTTDGQRIRFAGGLHATTLTTGAQAYDLRLGGASTVVTDTHLSNTGLLILDDGATAFFGGGLDHRSGDSHLGGTLTTGGQPLDLGAVTLIGNASLATTGPQFAGGAAINLVSVDADTPAGERTLSLDAGPAGTIGVTGPIGATAPLAGLTLVNSNGATFGGPVRVTVGPGVLTLTDTSAGQGISFTNGLTATVLTTTTQDYDLALRGTANRIETATTFNHLGTLTLGGAAGDTLIFAGGLTADAPNTVNLAGTLSTLGATLAFGRPVTLIGDTTLDAGAGDIRLAAVDGNQTLTLASAGTTWLTGTIGGQTPIRSLTTDAPGTTDLGADISAQGNSLTFNDPVVLSADLVLTDAGAITFVQTLDGPYDLTLNAAGQVLIQGAVGAATPLATLTLANSAGASFAAVTAQSLNLVDTTGAITLTGLFQLGTLITAPSGYDLALQGGGIVTGQTPTSFLNTGALTLGDEVADSTVFIAGLTATAPSIVDLAGTIVGVNAPIILGAGALTAATTLDSGGAAISLASLAGGGQNLTLAAGIGAGTTTVIGNVSNLGTGTGTALTVANGVTGLVRFQGLLGANSGLTAGAGTSVRFDQDVTLGDGNLGTRLLGAVQLDGLTFSGYDGLSFGATTLSGGPVTLNSNGGNITLASLAAGGQNLTLAAGIAAGTTTLTGILSNLGSGTGAALTVAEGVTGLVWFQDTLGGNSGLRAVADTSSLRFGRDVTLADGDTATSLPGSVQLDGLTFSGFDGLSFGPTALSAGPVTLDSNGGNLELASLAGAGQNLTLAAGIGAGTTTVSGSVSNLGSGIGAALTVADGVTGLVWFKDTLAGTSGLVAAATSSLRFDGDVTLANGDIATSLPGSVQLDGLTFSGFDGIRLGATAVTGPSTVNANGSALDLGATTLSDGVTLTLGTGSADTIRVANVTGPGTPALPANLTFDTTGSIGVPGSVALNNGQLRVTQSGGATFGATVNAATVALVDTSGTIAFDGLLTVETLTTDNQDYDLALRGGAAVTGPTATSILNTGALTLGDGADDTTVFSAGVSAAAPRTINLAGTLRAAAAGAALSLVGQGVPTGTPAVSVTADTLLDGSADGAITLGNTVLADGVTLSVGNGNGDANAITLGTLDGVVELSASHLRLNSAAAIQVGAIGRGRADGTDVGSVTLVNSGGATFAAITAATLALEDTAAGRLVDLQGDLTLSGGLTVAAGTGAFDVALRGSTNRLAGATRFNNTGILTLGDGALDTTAFVGGVTAAFTGTTTTAPSTVKVAGTLRVIDTGAPIQLAGTGVPAVQVTDDTLLDGSPDGAITLGNTVIADGTTLTVGVGEANPISIGTVDGTPSGAASNLTLDSLGAITVGAIGEGLQGSGTDIGTVLLANSGGATFGAIRAATLHLADTAAGRLVDLAGNLSLTTDFLVDPSANAFDLALRGTTNDIAIIYRTDLRNTGVLTLGDGGDSFAFAGGLSVLAPIAINLGGTLTSAGTAGIVLGNDFTPVNVTHDSGIGGTGTGALVLGPTNLAAGVTLTVGTGRANPITVGTVTGTTSGASNLSLDSTAAVTVGDLGPGIGAVTLTNSGGATFAGVTATTLTLAATTGTITLTGAFDLGTLTTGGGGFDLALRGGGTVTGTAPTSFLNSGRLTLGDAAGDSFSFAAGLIAATPGAISLAGSIGTTDAVLTLSPAVTLTGDTRLASGSGALRLDGAVDGAFALTLDSSGTTTLSGPLGAGTPLTGLTTDAVGSTRVAGNVTTNGPMAFNDAVTLANPATLTSGNGAITFGQGLTLGADLVLNSGSGDLRLAAVDGNQTLTLNSAGTTWLTGIIGGQTRIRSLTTDAPGSTRLGADVSAQGNSLTFDDWVYLDRDLVLTDQGNIIFAQGIDNHFDLTLDTVGLVLIQGPVGSLTPLQTLTLRNRSLASLAAVTADTLDLAGGSGSISIAGNLSLGTLSTGGSYSLALLGGTNTVTNAVTFANTGGLTLGGQAADRSTFAGGLRVEGPASIALAGTIRTLDQPLTVIGSMSLTTDTILDTTGSAVGPGDGAITLAGTLDGPTSTGSVGGPGATLTLVAGTGDLTQGAVIGGLRPLNSLTAGGRNLALSGPVTVTEGIALNALGAIDGAGLLTAASLTLDAQTGIGAGTPLALATPLILARSTGGTIALGNLSAGAATVSAVTTGGTGDILIEQSGGGALSVAQAGTAAGAIRLRSSAGLTTGAITAGGGGAIDYGAGAAGIRIEGPTSAPGGAVVIQTPGVLATGPGGSISAQALRILDAAMVGAASQPLQTAVGALTLTNVGATFLRNAGSLLVNDSTLTGGLDLAVTGDLTLMGISAPGQVVTLTAGGAIIDGNGTALNLIADTLNVQAGAGIGLLDWLGLAVGTLNAASQSGNIDIASSRTSTLTLSGLAADAGFIRIATGGPLIIGGSVRAGGLVELTTAGLLAVNAPVSGGTLRLVGGTIAFGPAGALTSRGTLSAVALTGDLSMRDGTLVQAGGAVTLSAAGTVALGRVTAGANPLSVTARAGAILDVTAAEGPGNENLVGGDLSLEAATGIGTAGVVGDLDTAAARLDARTTGAGGIYIDETDALQLGNQAPLTTGGPGADILVTTVGPLTIARDVRVSGSGDVWLTTTGDYGDLLVNANVETATGDIALISGAGIQRSGVAVLRNTVFDQGTVSLCAQEGIGSEAMPILLDAAIVAAFSAGRNGNSGIWLTQVAGLQGSLTFGPTPCPCANQGTPRTNASLITQGFMTANWTTIRGAWAALGRTWALAPPRFRAFSLADEFAVPDFGSIDESELLYLSGGNPDLWGASAQADEERRRREEQTTADAGGSAP